MNEFNVGATLLFVKRENQILEAVLKSYVLKNSTYQDVIEETKAIGEKQDIYCKFEYIGIEDVFRVVGPIEEGALLGRMTIWEQTLQDAKDLVLEPDKFTFNTQLNGFSGKWYLVTPIYFVQAEDTEDSRSISCHCLIESSDSSRVIEKSFLIAKSKEFKDKIIECDFEGLAFEELKFIGFEDIQVIYDDIHSGGAFMKMSKCFDSMDEIRSLVIDEEKLQGFFKAYNAI